LITPVPPRDGKERFPLVRVLNMVNTALGFCHIVQPPRLCTVSIPLRSQAGACPRSTSAAEQLCWWPAAIRRDLCRGLLVRLDPDRL